MRILLVDDNREVREALRLRIQFVDEGWDVREAATLTDARKMLGEECADLLVLDWEMPGAADPRTFAALRACCPGIRLIVLSGYPDNQAQAVKAGGDAFISKTDPPERIIATLRGM